MAGALLFLNRATLEQLGVANIADANREILGLTLVVTSSLFVTSLCADLMGVGVSWIRSQSNLKKIEHRLNNLTEDEKQILRYYLAENTRANTLRVEDGVVQGLKSSGVIYMSASMGNLVEGFEVLLWQYRHDTQKLEAGEGLHESTASIRWLLAHANISRVPICLLWCHPCVSALTLTFEFDKISA